MSVRVCFADGMETVTAPTDSDIKQLFVKYFGGLYTYHVFCRQPWSAGDEGAVVWAHWNNRGRVNKLALDTIRELGGRVGALQVVGPVLFTRMTSGPHAHQEHNCYAPLSRD